MWLVLGMFDSFVIRRNWYAATPNATMRRQLLFADCIQLVHGKAPPMCGIAARSGVIRPPRSHKTLSRDGDRLIHRGPDDTGQYRDDWAALGFRRLAIIDLPGGHQPLCNEKSTIWTVFNGEIYNFPALRRRLEAKGHNLRSSGDTEILVHLYEDEGTGMFSLLRGMFSLAIWDAPRRTLVVARDRLGQKPLVYHHDGRRLIFASELKALAGPAKKHSATPDRLFGA